MVLGVTGGIASGKSLVVDQFRRLGAPVVSADRLARDAVLPGSPTLARLVEVFGAEVLHPDGTLDREALGAIVFADPEARQRLNGITHPAIAALAERRIAELRRAGHSLIVYEAPLLFEAGARERVDAVLAVVVEDRLQVERLMARDGLDEERARLRINSQMPQHAKAALAEYVIDNSGSPARTAKKVAALYHRLTGGAPPV